MQLAAQGFAVEIVRTPDRMAVLAISSALESSGNTSTLSVAFFPFHGVRSTWANQSGALGQLDVELPHRLSIDENGGAAAFGACLNREMQKRPVQLDVARGMVRKAGHFRVGLGDVVHIDVAPASRGLVHDFEVRRLSGKVAHVPSLLFQPLSAARPGVRPGGAADDFPAGRPDSGTFFLQIPRRR